MPLTRFLRRILPAGAILAVLVPGAPATAADPVDDHVVDAGVRWAVQPSGPDGPTGRSWFTYDLAPGTEIVDWVGITNLSETTLDFEVYATDAYTTGDGAFALLPAGDAPRDLGSWFTMEAGRHRVPAGHRLDIPFRLTVPDNATPGDHAAGIIAAITARQSSADGAQVDLDRRVAARVYLRVDGPAQPAVTVESMRVAYTNPVAPWGDYTMTVTYVLRNTGNLRVTGAARLRAEGPFGWRLAAAEATDIPELLPGSALTVTETISGLAPAVRLTAAVDVEAVTVDGPIPTVTRTAGLWALPWLLLAAVLAVAAYLLTRKRTRTRTKINAMSRTLLLWRRRKRQSPRHCAEGAVVVVVVVVGLGLVLLAGQAEAQVGDAQVSVDRTDVAVGERLTVQLAGWPAGNVVVELCGNEAARGAADCAVGSSGQTYAGKDGTGAVQLTIGQPPVACPCVVRARDPAGSVLVTHPITVAGVTAEAAPSEPRPGALVVSDVAISGGWSWSALFGGPAPRTVTFTVQHHGDAALADPPLTLLVGRGEHPTTMVTAPELGTIGPDRSATYQVPVTLPAPTFGHYAVRGEVGGAAFLAETTSYPWGLTGVLTGLAAVTMARQVRRSRRARRAE